jgi:hypothetical protein
VPPTTALRWIGQMTEAGLLERVEDETDRRRAFIALTDKRQPMPWPAISPNWARQRSLDWYDRLATPPFAAPGPFG